MGTDFELIEHAIKIGALEFFPEGRELKSGRISPYFFNSGKFVSGSDLRVLSQSFLHRINEDTSESPCVDFEVLFGPAYKGIVLSALVVSCFAEAGMGYIEYAHDRKEEKTHGEGGMLVGATLGGKRVLIIDDVITDGATKDNAVAFVKKHGGTPVGLLIAFDRMEKAADSDRSASQLFTEKHGIPVYAVATAENLASYLAKIGTALPNDEDPIAISRLLTEYLFEYGAD